MNLNELNNIISDFYIYHTNINLHTLIINRVYNSAYINSIIPILNLKNVLKERYLRLSNNDLNVTIAYIMLKNKNDIRTIFVANGLLNIHIDNNQYCLLKKLLFNFVNHCLKVKHLTCDYIIRNEYVQSCINTFYNIYFQLMHKNHLIINYYNTISYYWRYPFLHSALINLDWNNKQLINDFNKMINNQNINNHNTINLIIQLNRYKLLPINYQCLQKILLNNFNNDWQFLESTLSLPFNDSFKKELKNRIEYLAAKSGLEQMAKQWQDS